MKVKRFSKIEAISFAWNRVKGDIWFYIQLAFIMIAVYWGLDVVKGPFEENKGLYMLISFILWMPALVMNMGVIGVALDEYDEKEKSFSSLYAYASLLKNRFICSVLSMIMVIIGFIFFIIPGIIFMVKLQFAGKLLVDKKMGPIEAMQNSWNLTKGMNFSLLIFLGMMIGINLIGLMSFFVGVLVTLPITILAHTYVYRELVKQSQLADYDPDNKPEKEQIPRETTFKWVVD